MKKGLIVGGLAVAFVALFWAWVAGGGTTQTQAAASNSQPQQHAPWVVPVFRR